MIAVNALVLAVTLLAISVLVLRVRPLRAIVERPSPVHADASPSVAVVIPARNEARNLPLLLDDLRVQTLAPTQIVVVDDHSTDRTAPLARAAGADVYPAPPRPAGWNPKVWALHEGASHVRAATIVFLDADVRLAPGALQSIVDRRDAAGGLVSVAPHHRSVGIIESLSAVCNVVAVAGGGPGFARHSRGAVGSCVAVSSNGYAAVGGHAASPATIVDDLDLAAAFAQAEMAVTLLRGGEVVTMRSYPDGLRAVISGWSKNLAAGMTRTSPVVGVIVAAWIAALVSPLALAAQRRWWPAALCWALVALHGVWITRRVGRFNLAMVSAGIPLIALFTTFVTLRSLLLASTGRSVDWKGRRLLSNGLESSRS